MEQLKNIRRKHHLKIIGYVIMPEHVHLVLVPPEGTKIGLVIRELKSKMAREYFAQSRIAPEGVTRVFWQRRCYDHNCRSVDSTKEKIQYCHMNPVKRGLVTDARMWKWSSFNWYQGMKNVPIEMDSEVLG